jgi:hypothetical protein
MFETQALPAELAAYTTLLDEVSHAGFVKDCTLAKIFLVPVFKRADAYSCAQLLAIRTDRCLLLCAALIG